jgi:hypothetical protein
MVLCSLRGCEQWVSKVKESIRGGGAKRARKQLSTKTEEATAGGEGLERPRKLAKKAEKATIGRKPLKEEEGEATAPELELPRESIKEVGKTTTRKRKVIMHANREPFKPRGHCRRCGEVGHNSRTCLKRVSTELAASRFLIAK